MSEARRALAAALEEALERKSATVDALSDRTKVPRSTLLAFLDRPVSAVMPGRAYLRGHLGVVARELDMDVPGALSLFDSAFPRGEQPRLDRPGPGVGPTSMALMAGLGGVAILAVVLAFAGTMG